MNDEKSVIGQVTGILLDTMRKLSANEMDTATAQAIAANGATVIAAAKAETDFVRAVKAIPREGVWGDRLRYLEPQVGKSAERELSKRLEAKIDDGADVSGKARRPSMNDFGPSAEDWK